LPLSIAHKTYCSPKFTNRYFKLSKLTSFRRQLNLYGFQAVSAGVDKGCFYHPLFLRGRPDLCRIMLRTRGQGRHGTVAARASDLVGQCQSFYDLRPCPPASLESPREDEEAAAMMMPCPLVKAISSSSSVVPHHQEDKKKNKVVSAAEAAADNSVPPSRKFPQVLVSTSSRGDAAPFKAGPQGNHPLTAIMMMEQGFCSSNSKSEQSPVEQEERTMEQHGGSSAVVVPRHQHRYLIARSTLDVVERSSSSSSPAPLLLESAQGLVYNNNNNNNNNDTSGLAAAASSFCSWTETIHYHNYHHEDDDVGHLYCYTSPEQQEEGFPFFHPVTPMYHKPAYPSATPTTMMTKAAWLPVPLSSSEDDSMMLAAAAAEDNDNPLFGDNYNFQYADDGHERTAY
jgi:hypothetical protein